MEQPTESVEQPPAEQPVAAPARKPVLSYNEALFVFLACMLVGFVGVLIGFVPLIAIAMAGPVVVSFLA